ncbi:MAG: molecular chaperone DnaJ [Mariprofundaceae bacterium]
MAKRDYYEVLGVDRDGDLNAIKRAYRKLAMQNHPDRNPNDEAAAERFREVTEAYEVLSDEEKRARYNQYGHAGVDDQMHDFWGGGGFRDSHVFRDFGDVFGDVLGDFFGGGGSAGGRGGRGSDLRYRLNMTLEEAAAGKEVELSIPKQITCDTCHGSGAKPGTNPIPCSTCGGHGQVQMSQGFFAIRRACPTCQGSGRRIESPCASCHGNGRVHQKKSLKVRIPAGVYDGAQVRVGSEGEAGEYGATPGDLYIVVELLPHAIFGRDGADLHYTMPITFPQAVFGAEVEVPTLEGKLRMKIQPGTETGKVYRLRGHGAPDLRTSGSGDLYVKIQIAVPKKLSKKQSDLLLAFADATGDELYPERSSFLDKARQFWDNLAGEVK